MKKVYFLSGCSGVGKTTIMNYLKTLLPDSYKVCDFDERGVPDNADHTWRLNQTKEWIKEGRDITEDNKLLLVCGFLNPDEMEDIQKDFLDVEVLTILLDGDADVIEKRLRTRNQNNEVKANLERVVGSAEDFIQNNTKFIPVLREIFKKHNLPIIDTTNKNPEEVAKEVVKLIQA
tara:strand:+ start:199 stop:726 length:528 start_codon:yes stop_codon:yes gene_type:complete